MTTQIVEYSKTDAALADLAQRFAGVVFDVTSTKGMQEAKVARAELRGYRVDLEKVRVEIKAPALERCRLIDAEAKRITSALVELEDQIDSTIKKEEKRKEEEAMAKVMAEQRRKDGIQVLIEAIRGKAMSLVGKSSRAIADALEVLEATLITEAEFAEFTAEAQTAKDAAVARVRELHVVAVAAEADQIRIAAERIELAKLRVEADQRERDHRSKMAEEERVAREVREAEDRKAEEARAAENARMAADRAALRAEQEKAEAERREIQRKENELLDARGMLATFKSRFGHLPEFSGVVAAIDALSPKRRRAAA